MANRTNQNSVRSPHNSAPSIEELRALRTRTKDLLGHIDVDLEPFLNDDLLTFVRTPKSDRNKGDINVTTTCSCVMALALTNRFDEFYRQIGKSGSSIKSNGIAILESLIEAPWMSSGLSQNNAFTTTLVLRTFGFLVRHGLVERSKVNFTKPWGLQIVKDRATALASKLARKKDFLYFSLSDRTRAALAEKSGRGVNRKKRTSKEDIEKLLKSDLQRIVHSGWIYEKTRFPSASRNVSKLLTNIRKAPTSNRLA